MSFTLEPLRRLIKSHGASRVSDEACRALARVLEDEVRALALEAKKIAEHAGRRTITAADVKLARKAVEAGVAETTAARPPAAEPAREGVK